MADNYLSKSEKNRFNLVAGCTGRQPKHAQLRMDAAVKAVMQKALSPPYRTVLHSQQDASAQLLTKYLPELGLSGPITRELRKMQSISLEQCATHLPNEKCIRNFSNWKNVFVNCRTILLKALLR